MLSCPHCLYPLAGSRFHSEKIGEVFQTDIACSHCKAILRVTVTTLRDPDPEAIKKKNTPDPTTTYCPKCQEAYNVGSKHECSFYRPETIGQSPVDKLPTDPVTYCPHGHAVTDPINYPNMSGNCPTCRGQMK